MSVDLFFWGRQVKMSVRYECSSGEEVQIIQREAFQRIVSSPRMFDEALPALEEYILRRDGNEIGCVVKEIFEFVDPKVLFIKRSDFQRVVAIMLDYRFDPEEGIAILFEDERLVSIGPQNLAFN